MRCRSAWALALAGALTSPALAQPPPYPGAGQPPAGASQPGQPQAFPGGQPPLFPAGQPPWNAAATPANPTPASMVGTVVGISPEAGTISVQELSPQMQVQGQQPYEKPRAKPTCMTFRIDQTSQLGGASEQGSPWAKQKPPGKEDWGKWGKRAWAKGAPPEQLQVGQMVQVFYETGYGKPTWGKMKPGQAPPEQTPPTQAPPSQPAPPTQGPPTQAPPDQATPQQSAADQGPAPLPPMEKGKGKPGQDQPSQANVPPAPQPGPPMPQLAADQPGPQGPPAMAAEPFGPQGPPAPGGPATVTAGYPPSDNGPPAEGKAIGPGGSPGAMAAAPGPVARAISIRILPRAAGPGAEPAPPPAAPVRGAGS